MACLPEQRRLLVAGYSGNRQSDTVDERLGADAR